MHVMELCLGHLSRVRLPLKGWQPVMSIASIADRGTSPGTSRLIVFATDGTLIGSVGGNMDDYSYGPPQFVGVTVGSNGTVYVTDHANHRVMIFAELPTAARTTSWGRIKSIYR